MLIIISDHISKYSTSRMYSQNTSKMNDVAYNVQLSEW